MPHTSGVRQARKSQTRQTLLDTALHLAGERSLSGVSLREITRAAGIVPTGFYRHFPDVESLGVALVEQCLGGLRTAVRAVRADGAGSDEVIERSIEVLVREVHAQRERFRFIARERYGGMPRVRRAIREQLDQAAAELAGDLRTGELAGALADWPPADLRMLSTLLVNHVVQTAAALLELPRAEPEVAATAGSQLRLIIRGAQNWHG